MKNRCAYCGAYQDEANVKASKLAYGKVVCDDCCARAEEDERERFLAERDAAQERFRDEWGVYP